VTGAPYPMPHISAAVWHGPVAMSYFDERLTLSYARQISRWTLLSIGDLTPGDAERQSSRGPRRNGRGAKNGHAVESRKKRGR
jgi:hypothetical protein